MNLSEMKGHPLYDKYAKYVNNYRLGSSLYKISTINFEEFKEQYEMDDKFRERINKDYQRIVRNNKISQLIL